MLNKHQKELSQFINIAKQTKSVEAFIKEVRTIKNVPKSTADLFYKLYNPKGDKTIYQASEVFIKEVAAS